MCTRTRKAPSREPRAGESQKRLPALCGLRSSTSPPSCAAIAATASSPGPRPETSVACARVLTRGQSASASFRSFVSGPKPKVSSNRTARPRQKYFRYRVAPHYADQCAFCPIDTPRSWMPPTSSTSSIREPTNPRNGILLCAIHHRAFDRRLVAIHPDIGVIMQHSPTEYLAVELHRVRPHVQPSRLSSGAGSDRRL